MRRVLLSLLFLSLGVFLYAQEPIRFGDREVYLEANVRPAVRGHKTSSLELGVPTGERLNVLVQFAAGKIAFETLKQKGVELGDYLGSNAYYAKVMPGSRPSDFAGIGLRSVVPIRGEWKVVHSLLQGQTPEWATEGDNLKVNLVWFNGVTAEQVKADLSKRGLKFVASSDLLRTAQVTATYEQILALAEAEYVASIRWIEPPMELQNYRGARLSGATNLRMSPELGGRGLTGKGVRIGIWDGNVAEHVDYGNRTHCEEFEMSLASSGGHGMHTTGTILGAGLLDERARGMAPEAEGWTWNFNRQSNGLTVGQEMLKSKLEHNISITSNSYGLSMSRMCRYEYIFNYTELGNQHLDILACYFPTLTHSFSAGNDQGACRWEFGHMSNYAKNIISVAALTPGGKMTDFSSFGPLRDGRMFPIISARGESVYSVMPEQSYSYMSGTSMSCPTVTGHLALLTQRWGQLHGGALPFNYYLKALIANTADDAGNAGPDYKFGFGVLNSLAAVTAMENNWHHFASLARGGEAQTKSITVPAGVKELRVMICWNDPVVFKEYKTGECPLVNDLDLTVENGTNSYFPYTLDPKNPNTPAVADKKNAVDNIEQVVIKNPTAGEYTLKVAGTVHQEEKQDYVVVWYFDYQQAVLTSPIAGDVYSPGDEIFLHTANLAEKLKVELSTDGGGSYFTLKDAASLCDSIAIPTTTPSTDKAILRVTDANGQSLQSGEFAIMGQVQGLKLKGQSCSASGWTLSWRTTPNAAQYEILRADVNKGTYTVIKTIAAVTEFVLPESAVLLGERNVYAVRAIDANGVKGPRSRGVIAQGAAPKTFALDEFPYTESFVGYPLRYAETSEGENIGSQLYETPASFGLAKDSHMLAWQALDDAPEWDKPFEKQRKNVATLTTCKLNLASTTGKKPQLSIYYYLKQSKREKGTLLRLLVNGVEMKDMLGRSQIVGDDLEHFATYDLAAFAGKEIQLEIEVALANNKDGATIAAYQLYLVDDRKDVGIVWANEPAIESKAQMQDETVYFKVMNNSTTEQTNIPVSVQVDDKVVYTTTLKSLKPFEDRILAYTHNFAGEEAHKFNVIVRTGWDGDAQPENNEMSFEVYNMGNVLPMPEITIVDLGGGKGFPNIPYVSKRISGKINFTDGRGELEPYKAQEEAVLQILPTKPNVAVQATFKEYDFAEDDELYVFTSDVPDNLLMVSLEDADYVIRGSSKTPLTFVSNARDGGLTFAYMGASGERKKGWIAELSEVALPDRWELAEVKEAASTDPTLGNIEVGVKNLLPIPLKDIPLYLTIDGEVQKTIIPELAANEAKTVTLEEKLMVEAPMRAEVLVELGKDGNTANNKKALSVVHDPIWNGGGTITSPATLAIATFQMVNEDKTITLSGKPYVDYLVARKIPFYTETKNEFKFTLNNTPTAEQATNAAIRLFVDNNDNGTLAETSPEFYKVDLVAGQKEYTLSIDLAGVSGLNAGDHRMRILLANNDNYTKFKEQKPIEWGHAVDFTAQVNEGVSPLTYEMAILGIEGIESGRKGLTSATPLKVKLKNNGLATVTSLDIKIEVDDLPVVEKTLSVNIAPRGGEAIVDTNNPVDLSTKGKHNIKVTLVKEDKNVYDNETSIEILRMPEITNVPYTLNFEGIKNERMEMLPTELGAGIQNEVTVEGWWKTNKPQTCAFVNGGDDGLYLGTFEGSAYTPTNALVFFAGKAAFMSKEGVLTNNQWHHIAVVASHANNKTTAKAYVDGVEVELVERAQGDFKVTYTLLNLGVDGENLMFRLWKTKRTPEQINATKAKSVRSSLGGALPAECVAEFVYTEGEGKLTSFGDESRATIVTSRTDDKLWKKFEPKLCKTIEVEGQVIPVEITGGNAIATMPFNFTDFSKVKVKFISEWADVEIEQGGTKVTSATELNFANPAHELTFDLKLNILDVAVNEQIVLKLKTDKSPACEMLALSMLTANNAGLKEDITLNAAPLPSTLLLEAENASESSQLNPSDVVLKVVGISPNATLYNGDKKQQTNEEFHADLTKPLTLRVVAENERDVKFYTIRLAMGQEIVWESAKLEYNYGVTTGEALQATSTSKLPITYVSENSNVAIVNVDGKLEAVGVGKTKIFAKQAGNAIFKPAAVKEREVEVKPVPITIRVENAEMEVGDKIPEFEFTYETLLFPNTEDQFSAPYVIRTADNSADATMPLTKGTYQIVPKDYSGTYLLGNYRVTRGNGTLTVKDPVKAKAVTFSVKDGTNAVLPAVDLQIGGQTIVTNTEGVCTMYLLPGKYVVTATKDGYTTDKKAFEVTNAALAVDLQLLKKEFTLTYTVDPNGMLQGVATQKVASGCDGEQVIAVPKDIKYRFKEWSDNHSTNAARTDKAVTGNIAAQAIFETFVYKLQYAVSEGGRFTTAEATKSQEVTPGTDGQSVTVAPEVGYIFLGWSDGVTTLTRTDKNVMVDLNVTARFFKPYLLTWREDFELNASNMEAWEFQKPNMGAGWHVIPLATINKRLEGKGLALAPSYEYPEQVYPSLWAATPWLSIEHASAKVVISYDRYVRKYYSEPVATLEYSFGNDLWVKAHDIDKETEGVKTETFTLDATALAGHDKLRFRWAFEGIGIEAYLVIDNVKVAYETPTQAVLRYYAGENGKLREGTTTDTKEAIELTTTIGVKGTKITAVPAAGYVFDRWSDDFMSAERQDDNNITVTALFKPESKPTHVIQYKAGEHGMVTGLLYQVLEEGATTAGVSAIASDGYAFKQWDDGKKVNPRSDVVGTEDKIYTAEFAQVFTLTYEAGEHGSIKGEATQNVFAGESGSAVEAVPDNGYRFVKWDDNKTDNPRTELNVTESKTYTAQFELIPTYAVTLKHNGEGELKITGIEESKLNAVPEGTELIAVATPKTGWKLKSLTAGTQDISSDGKFTVTADVEVKAVFEEEGAPQPKTYVVTLTKEGEGELTITGIEESKLNAVPEGTKLTAVATPKTGWKLKSLTAGTQDISSDGKFTVTADVEVKAVFEEEGTPQPKTFAVTLKKEGEGELKITGIEEDKLNAVPEGTKLTAVATPKTGWKLKSLTAGTQDIKTDGKFTVTADVEVKAVFVKSTSVDDAVFANVLVAPNPFTTQLRLVCNGATGRYDLLNASGVVVRSGNVDGNEVLIETTDLTSGLYLLRLTAESGATKVVTVVKE